MTFIINVCACRDVDLSRLGRQNKNPTYNNKAVFHAKTALFVVNFAAKNCIFAPQNNSKTAGLCRQWGMPH